ncbi:helix-turn-helix transcriptional regulator [Nocardia sp. NPDC051833]|uniref:helix-turn-helix domain-containing protein n=1 Tax=Nocardia sp. NPDC051833 TaxID=3155674 RepID=UPI0034289C54
MTEGPKNMDQALGRVIAKHRTETPLTQEAMAEVLETSSGRVKNLEQGRQAVPMSYLWECAGLFSCQVTDLVAEAEELLRQRGIVPTRPQPNTVVRNIGRSLGF